MKTQDVKNKDDLVEYLKKQTGYAHLMRKGDGRRVYEMMVELTSFLPSHTKAKIRADFIIQGLSEDDVPVCPHCSNKVTVQKEGNRWAKTCGSEECQGKKKRQSIIETSNERYGTDFPNQNKEVYENGTFRGMLQKYGSHFTQTDEYSKMATGREMSESTKTKIKESLIETFADPIKKEEIVKRREKTYFERTSHRNPSQNPEVIKKSKEGYYQKTGYKNPSQNPEVIEKSKRTQEKNYGGWYLSSDKAKQDRIASFGHENFFSTEEFRKMRENMPHHLSNDVMRETIHVKEWCENFIVEHGMDLIKMSDHANCSLTSTIRWLESHGLYSSKERGETVIEGIVRDILDSCGVEYTFNKYFYFDDCRRQADFFIPNHDLAIECNGNFFHSDIKKSDKYHLEKTELFGSIGVQLLHFFEDEILDKRHIVESMILSKISKIPSLGARSTRVKEISSSVASEFYTKFHIQGMTKASVHYGSFNKEGELVAAMSFRDYGRNLKEGEVELVRFASKVRVVGGFSKMVSHFCKKNPHYKRIISYADRRVSNGGVYASCGFDLVDTTPPSYYYVSTSNYLNRMRKEKFKKSLIREHLAFFDGSLTERENMERNGFARIYDCGLLKYAKDL